MGFFSRKPDRERELAMAIGKRGLGARAEIEAARRAPPTTTTARTRSAPW